MKANTTGNQNTAVGMDALTSNTTGAANVAIGYAAAINQNCNYSVIIGDRANGSGSLSGDHNTFIGHYSGSAVALITCRFKVWLQIDNNGTLGMSAALPQLDQVTLRLRHVTCNTTGRNVELVVTKQVCSGVLQRAPRALKVITAGYNTRLDINRWMQNNWNC